MAYSVSIESECQRSGCTKRATEAVYGYRNDRFGRYCKRHAAERVRELNEAEKRNPAGFDQVTHS